MAKMNIYVKLNRLSTKPGFCIKGKSFIFLKFFILTRIIRLFQDI